MRTQPSVQIPGGGVGSLIVQKWVDKGMQPFAYKFDIGRSCYVQMTAFNLTRYPLINIK